jgi:hypothetical protein
MPGDDRRRFCAECGHDVHAVAEYSEAEWAALLAKGRVCAYSLGETAGPAQSRRTVIAGALLTTISPLLAQSGVLRVIVTDSSGAPVGRSEVTLACNDRTARKMQADANGVAEFTALPFGNCEMTVRMAGFRVWRGRQTVTRTSGAVTAQLEIGEVTMGIIVEAAGIQSPAGLRVVVTDAGEVGIERAEVSLVCAGGQSRKARSDAGGIAEFRDLPVGECAVKVERAGFQAWRGSYAVSPGVGRMAARLEVGTVGVYVQIEPVTVEPTPINATVPAAEKPAKKRKRFWRKD